MRLGDLGQLYDAVSDNWCGTDVASVSDILDFIKDSPTIDPETLPIVQELRNELERVARERDALIWDMKVFGSGCYSCKHFDVINKKCKANEPCGVNNNWEWKGIQWEE